MTRLRIAGIAVPTAARSVTILLLVLAGIGAVVLDALPAGNVGASKVAIPVGRRAAEPPTAAAYRYPLGCMGAAPSVGGGDSRAASPCWRYGVYVTAILRQVHGVWRLALEAVSRSCPVVALPGFVRAQVAVCRRPTGAGGSGR